MQNDIQHLLQTGRYPEALGIAENACIANPDRSEPWLLKAAIHAQSGNLVGVIDACEQALRLQPDLIPARYNLAVALQNIGRVREAIDQYRSLLKAVPAHAAALTNLGLLYRIADQPEEALINLEKAAQISPGFAPAHNALGLTYSDVGRHTEALTQFHYALQLEPGLLAAAVNIARTHWLKGDTQEANTRLEQLLTEQPGVADALLLKAQMLYTAGLDDAAIEQLEVALTHNPNDPRIHYELACRLVCQGMHSDALKHYQTAIRINPTDYQSLNNLGTLLHTLGRTREGLTLLDKAAAINAVSVQIQINLSMLHAAAGNDLKALNHCLRALRLEPNKRDYLQRFAGIAGNSKTLVTDNGFEQALLDCFADPGIDRQKLTAPVLSLLLADARITELCSRCAHSLPAYTAFNILWEKPHAALLERALSHTVIPHAELEQCLRAYRSAALRHFIAPTGRLIHHPSPDEYEQLLALAHQCFNNEFIYTTHAEEDALVTALYDRKGQPAALATDEYIGISLFLSLYRPLPEDLPEPAAGAEFSDRGGALLAGLWKKHTHNLRRERQLKDELNQLTPITDDISAAVRDQYEESPYPRWLSLDLQSPKPYTTVFRETFPHFDPPDFGTENISTLIAGCGTGKHALLSATRFQNSRVTAVDLSRSSLAYASRSAQEFGIDSIEFHCADILQLNSIGRRFHIIESVGVLHHLAEPESGLAVLRSLLVPHGLMNLGFYSTRARHAAHAARAHFHTDAGLPDLDGIRRARLDILSLPHDHPIYPVTGFLDFYSLSDCRDLLFHTQETCYSLPEITGMLERAKLDFIGFELSDTRIKSDYQERFPDDPALRNLNNWDRYEQEHPDTFVGMYVFWCQARS